METNNVTDPQKPKMEPPSPLLVLGLLSLCSVLTTALICGSYIWALRNPINLPILAGPNDDSIQQIATDPAWTLLLEDHFSDNANHWDVAPYQNNAIQLNRSIEHGKYNWYFQVKTGYDFWEAPQTEGTFTDFTASLDVRHPDGAKQDSYGMVFRETGGDRYIFSVDESGRYYVFLHYKGHSTNLQRGSVSFVIKPGEVNRIAVKATGPVFAFYVNDHRVGIVVDDTLRSGKVGVYVSPYSAYNAPVMPEQTSGAGPTPVGPASTYEMDNFTIWVPTIAGAQATSPLTPQEGTIVYVTDRDGNREIYSIGSNGMNSIRLTDNPADDFSPKWSPSGDRIAFVSTRDGNPEIYVMNRDGSGLTRITNHSDEDTDPAWSPDGKKIVFASNRDGNYEIYIHYLKGNTETRITNDPAEDRYPDWSPDGKLLILQSRQNGKFEIYKLDLATNAKRLLMNHAVNSLEHASWSPSGKTYLYEEKLQTGPVFVVTNGYPRRNYSKILFDKYQNLWPCWSPNGEQILFASDRSGQFDLYIMTMNGDSFFRLTNDSSTESEMDWTVEE